MDFHEINKVNFNNVSSQKKEQKEPAKESPNEQKEDLKQTPNDPSYWQSAIGVKNSAVSFSENNETCNALINASNLKDFQEFSKNMQQEDALEAIKQFQNPKTGLFDYNIVKKQQELEERRIDQTSALAIAKSCIDGETGLISELAENVIDIFYPPQKNSIKDKFRNIIIGKIQTNSSLADSNFSNLLDSLKDSNGKFRKENNSYLYSIIKANRVMNKYCLADVVAISELIKGIKDENGIIDRAKASNAIKLVRETKKYQSVANVFQTLSEFPKDKQKNIYQKCMQLVPTALMATENFTVMAKYCFEKNGDIKKENYDFTRKLILRNLIIYDEEFFNLCTKYPKLKDLLCDLTDYTRNSVFISPIGNIFEKYTKDDGTIDEELKNNILKFIKITGDLSDFEGLYEACYKNTTNEEEIFDNALFEKALKLINYEKKLCNKYNDGTINGKTCADILKEKVPVSEISFGTKINLLNSLKTIRDYIIKTESEDFSCLSVAISDIEESINLKDIGLPIDEKAKTNFIKNILATKGSKAELTEFEKVITNSIPKLEEMTDGIEITYSRQEFLKDLSKICNSEEKLETLIEKTGIIPILNEKDNINEPKITGYNGIIELNQLNLKDPTEKQLYDCLYKFLYENEAKTGNLELDKQLNHILKACPEFINIIGKKQHATQHYTVDVHSLLVLAYSIKNPDYLEKLNPQDRILLKICAIFHDIMKQENIVDKGHQNLSSFYTKSIIKKIIKVPELQDRIYEIIDNHHWSEEYSKAEDKNEKAMELAYRFRRPNDFEIAKIIARSDLKAVNDDFYEKLKGCLEEDNLEPIQKNIDFLYSTGNAIFTNKIVSPEKLNNHIETKNGVDYKVINLHKLDDETDMGEYGFSKGTQKKDLKFLVHMVDPEKIYEDLNTIKLLSSPLNGGVLSESLISPKYKRTYCDRKYGVLLSEINTNIVTEAHSNQSSGHKKEFSNIIDLVFNNCKENSRKNFKNELLSNLNIPQNNVKDEEYAQFFKTVLAAKTSLTEINPNKEFKLGNHKITGEQLINAINKYQDNLIDKTEHQHNEIVGYTPKIHAVIAKSTSLNKLPDDLLKFAHENNLPVILL